MSTKNPLRNSAKSLLCICVDPDVALIYHDIDDITRREIVMTDAQAAFVDGIREQYKGANARLVCAFGTDTGAWRFTFAYRALDGSYCTDIRYIVAADGSATFDPR